MIFKNTYFEEHLRMTTSRILLSILFSCLEILDQSWEFSRLLQAISEILKYLKFYRLARESFPANGQSEFKPVKFINKHFQNSLFIDFQHVF